MRLALRTWGVMSAVGGWRERTHSLQEWSALPASSATSDAAGAPFLVGAWREIVAPRSAHVCADTVLEFGRGGNDSLKGRERGGVCPVQATKCGRAHQIDERERGSPG